jgi:hypothetical protein
MMKCKTRKLIFTAATAILISFLLTCIPLGPPDDNEDFVLPEFTDVEYSPDGSSVTIYLDGSAPVRHSRALSRDLAVLGHDLFEVSFYHQSSGTMVRAVWETGQAAGISGVVRGVNYNRTSSYGTTIPSTEGAALLFVGKKSDRTLLAVGSLTSTTNIDGTPGAATTITPTTRSVTFSVAALRAGVSDARGPSSFKTDAIGNGSTENDYSRAETLNTDVFLVTIGNEPFPLFRMDEDAVGGQWIHGRYYFEVVTGVNDFDNIYRNGIIKKDNIEVVFPDEPSLRIPRYPNRVGAKVWETSTSSIINKLEVDETTGVTANNTANGIPLPYPYVEFKIGQTQHIMDGKVFAFSFQVPVYPISSAGGRDTGFSWYLRPGYDSFNMDLDDGREGTGGAILMGTGKFKEAISYNLFIRKTPDKTRYNSSPYIFDYTGMQIFLRIGNYAMQPIGLDDTDLYYVIHHTDGRTTIINQGYNLYTLFNDPTATRNGVLKVLLRYYGTPVNKGTGGAPYINSPLENNPDYNGDPPYTGEFLIYYFNVAGINFATGGNRRYVIVNQEDFYDFQNNIINNNAITDRTFVLVFFNNYNLGALTLTRDYPIFIIVLAGAPGVIIGKSAAAGSVFNDNAQGNAYYFGAWPFDEILSVQGLAIESYSYILNTAGPWEDVTFTDGEPNTTTTTPAGYYISGGAGSLYTVGTTLVNPTRLRPGYTPP